VSDQQAALQRCIDVMWQNPAFRSMLRDGFERLTGPATNTLRFAKPTNLPVRPPTEPLATIVESTVTIREPMLTAYTREPTLAEIQQARAALDDAHSAIVDELLGGPVVNGVARPCDHRGPYCTCTVTVSQQAYGSALTPDDLQRLWRAMQQTPLPPPQRWTTDFVLACAGCTERGCAVEFTYDEAKRQHVVTHNTAIKRWSDAVWPREPYSVESRVGDFMRWTAKLHQRVDRGLLCGLCGQERDPDQEPVVLELPPGGPNPDYVYARHGSIEACSPHCATAYAMQLDLAREHEPVLDLKRRPDLREVHEQHERYEHAVRKQTGHLVTDSETVKAEPRWPIFKYEP